jgi:hypothetical protein
MLIYGKNQLLKNRVLYPDSHCFWKLDLDQDQHSGEKLDPYPH